MSLLLLLQPLAAPTGNGPFDIRLSVEDRAGNFAEKILPGGASAVSRTTITGGGAPPDNVEIVNSKSITFDFEVREAPRE